MNFKTTLVMLVLLAGIVGAYLWTRSIVPGPISPAETLPDAFVTGREFTQILIELPDQHIELQRQDRGWWQTAPVRFPVTGEAVESLINAGLSLTPREVFFFSDDDPLVAGQGDALASFGLKPPRATIIFHSDTGEHRLLLGNTNIGGSAYLQQSGDDAVYLVDTALHQVVLDADPKAWRPQKLPTLDASRVNQISLVGGPQNITLSRTAAGWSLRPEGGERANDELALNLAAIAQQLQPRGYVSDDPAALGRYGLAEPRLQLTTADATGAQQTLRLGQPADLKATTRYATWSDGPDPSPVVFLLPAATLKDLDRLTPDLLRDARVVTALPGTIRGQQVNRVGRDTLTIAHRSDGSGLAFVEPQTGYAPDLEQASAWLTTLTRVAPVGHARAPREAQAPLALIELQLTGGRTEYVRLYIDRDGRDDVVLAVRENETVAALIPRDQVAPLLAPVVMLRDRRLPDAGSLNELRLTRDDGESFRFTKNKDRWVPQNADFTDDWEAQRFDELGRWLQAPFVESWTAQSALPRGPVARLSLGDDRPAYSINVDQNLGERTDLPGVFRLPPGITSLFAEEYRQRLLIPYRPDQITRVELGLEPLANSTKKLPQMAVVSRSRQGIYQDAQGQRYDHQADCAALFNTLAGLSAKRIIPPLLPEQRQTPIKYWQLETADGQTHRLMRYNQGVWSLGNDTYFYIDVETDRQLTRKETAWGQALILPETP